ncbi:cation diffusion facilitator family transporter [Roseateles sp. BYS180W]|uniref:Cation diffusion facilitator family transporter n=1 Tax=Roseateles rivi TaxID=3299028 RepID=A0ABW7FW59_9BURK
MQISAYLKLSVAVAVATIALKTAAWWWTDSVSLLSDALESVVNLAGAVFGLAMVSIASAPADDEHPWGHHKAEYFSSGFEGVLIFVAALGIIWAGVHRWLTPAPMEALGLGIGLSVFSSALNGGLAFYMLRAAHQHRSIALEADARHLFTDVWTSAGVVLGLIGVMLTGWTWLDPLMAILVALNILREGWHLIARSAHGLMDKALEAQDQQSVQTVLQRHAADEVRFDHLRTRTAGQRHYVDLHMHMPEDWSLGRAAALRNQVEKELMAALPGLRASIQMLPMGVEAHFDDSLDPDLPRLEKP